MPISSRWDVLESPGAAILGWTLAIGSASCQALPPPARADARAGVVRAGSPEKAREIAEVLDDLFPAVISSLPDAHARRVEVWVQEEPKMYTFPATLAYRDADGFFSERLGRIHLRAGSDDVERTLAHELVHASLGRSWRAMPGTLEEGLCDVVAARLCPGSAARLRAGRLLAAALAIGGLDLEVRIALEPESEEAGSEVSYVQRLFSAEGPAAELDPCDVFREHAGVSSSAMPSERKKALYGLAFLVAERIVERRGIDGFHRLVRSLSSRKNRTEAADAILSAAELSRDPMDWRRALAAALGPAELSELSKLHPGLLVGPAAGVAAP